MKYSTDNSNWSGWTALTVVDTAATSGNLSVSPPATRGYYRRFRVRTRGSGGASYYSGWTVSTNSVRKNTEPIKPATVDANSTEYIDEDIIVTWSGASSGTSAIKGYMIGYRTSADNAVWSSWSTLEVFDLAATEGSRTVTPPYIPGIYVQYGVWTIDAFDVYSDERISDSIRCAITVCGPPSLCALSTALAEGDVTLSWSGETGGMGNAITAFEVQYAESADGFAWEDWTALIVISSTETYSSLTVSPPAMRGYFRRFRVCVRGSIGEVGYSVWTVSSGSVRRKRLPPAPIVAAPIDASSTFNTSPRVLITTGVEPDGQTQIIEIQTDDGDCKNSIDNAELFSVNDELSDNMRTVYMGTVLSPGNHEVMVRCYDGLTETRGVEVTLSFVVLELPFGEVIANETHVKAVHIQKLCTAVNAVRSYYGFDETRWKDDIVAGRTYIRDWPYHILELRGALIGVTAMVQAYGGTTVFGLPDFEWIAVGTGRPRADVMNQLKNLVLIL